VPVDPGYPLARCRVHLAVAAFDNVASIRVNNRMGEPTYLNFDLQIEPWNGRHRARVIESPVGRGCCSQFSLSLDNADVPAGGDLEDVKAVGARLFKAVFDDEIYSYLRRSQDEADRQGADGLRIRLLLTDVPELADLPWEYLYDPVQDQFLSLSTKTPVVRYLDVSQRIPPLAVKSPLRILVMISAPGDQPAIDVDREWHKLSLALAELQARGRVVLELLDDATLPTLQTRLRRGEYHVFHYVGHGGFDEQAQDGVLILENEAGLSQPVNGQVLGTLLQDEGTLRLALLNACEGARGSRHDPFSGTAQSLVRRRIPAVIAMQTAISDDAAKTFAYEFYRALADDYPVDAALTEARKAIFMQGNLREWATPVLFMRSSDGRLEEVAEKTGAASTKARAARPQEAVYRKTVRVGSLALPASLLLALPALLVAALAVAATGFVGPAQMGGRFNVAIADAGIMDGSGQMHRTAESQMITRWLVASVERANASSQQGGVTLWHDGLSLRQKRTRLGMVSGKTAQDRAGAAARLADRIDAHVLIYGHVTSDGGPARLILEFYVAPRVRLESMAVVGRYQLGDPIPAPAGFEQDPLAAEALATRVQDRAALLFWLMLGLRDDLLGRPADALATLRQAEAQLAALREQGDGKEHLYYLEGRAALFMDFYDEAEAALQRALKSNPRYARAQTALGSVYLDRAQTLQTPEERLQNPGDVEAAVRNYEAALALARDANEPLTEVIVHLALAGAYRLEAETYKSVATPDLARAGRLYDQAIGELRPVLEPLASAQQVRLLAQAYSTLGAAYLQKGQLLEIQGDGTAATAQYRAAREAYDGCIQQGAMAPDDDLLRTEIIDHEENGCRHWAGVVDDILSRLDGGQK
jgi:tetratricopeptide (TPR) repeat protein